MANVAGTTLSTPPGTSRSSSSAIGSYLERYLDGSGWRAEMFVLSDGCPIRTLVTDMTDMEDRGIRSGGSGEDIAGPPVIAYTTEKDAYRPVRQTAQAHALDHGCVLVLYAADAAGFLSEPLPNAIDADGAGDRFGGRLGLADLEYLGRAAIASQVVDARESGARVAAWMPKGHGVGALADYAHAQRAHIVFLPEQLAVHDELSALLGELTRTTAGAGSDIRVQVVGSAAQ